MVQMLETCGITTGVDFEAPLTFARGMPELLGCEMRV
jgi:hypothetical protein